MPQIATPETRSKSVRFMGSLPVCSRILPHFADEGWIWRGVPQQLLLRQGSVDKVNGNGAFSHSGCYSLHIPGANIAYRKHARKARLQHLRRAAQGPSGSLGYVIQVPPGQDEAFVIQGEAAPQPFGARGRTGHDKYVANVVRG